MAYFDSPKNRAMWEREMRQLRTERENRKKGISTAVPTSRESDFAEEERKERASLREATSFAELMQEEAEEVRTARKQKSKEFKKELSEERQKNASKTTKKEKSKSLGG